MIGTSSWSKKHWIATIAVALAVWLVYVFVGPGDDYFRCYTWMVMEPWRLPQVADYPWTLNPPWIVPFNAPFVSLPGRPGYIVFMAAMIAMTVYGAYVFGGKPVPILLSAHMMWILWWGQIEGWGILGLVLGWFAYRKKSWWMMFLALVLASFKPQISFIPVVFLWLWMGKEQWKSLLAILLLLGFSLWVWGPWPVWYYTGIVKFLGDSHNGPWNASLGFIALPLFIPTLLIPMDREKRLMAIMATSLIVFPYMPYYTTVSLMIFAVPWWAYLFGFLGYLPSLIGTKWAWNAIVLMPILVLLWLYYPSLKEWISGRFQHSTLDAQT